MIVTALLVTAVRTVAQGRKYVTPEIAQMLVESLTAPAAEQAHQKLSDRELQTLVMIASGKRLSDIAEELKLSPKSSKPKLQEGRGDRQQKEVQTGIRDGPGRDQEAASSRGAAQGLLKNVS